MSADTRSLCLLMALSLCVTVAPAHPQQESSAGSYPDTQDVPPSELRAFIEMYTVDRGTLNRSYAVEASPVRDDRLKRFYTEWLRSLEKTEFDELSHDGQVDYVLFKNHIERELERLAIQSRTLAETKPLVPFAQTIVDLAEARRRMERIDAAMVAASLTRLKKEIEKTRRGVEAGLAAGGKKEKAQAGDPHDIVEPIRVKKTVANRAVGIISSLRNTLRGWAGFYSGYDPIFTWWVDEPYKALDQTLREYSTFLAEKVVGLKPLESRAAAETGGGGERGRREGAEGGRRSTFERGPSAAARPGDSTDIVGDPIGREALLAELAFEMIPYTPEELIVIANKELEWCEGEMRKASRDLGYGDDWRRALEHVKTKHVEPGKQPELILELALEAIKFVEDHDLVTVPPLARESWRMEMMPPERQLINPFFTGGETISVSYPTSSMSHEQKLMSMRGNNIHFSRATVHHELIPGHHLQGFMTSRYKNYRSPFATPFWGEGWALYWELLLWDMGFAKTPENRIGMLFWRMHRCARIIFSLSFHLEKMSPQECIELLVKRVGHEPENATAEVRRSFESSYGPLYQAAYLLGGLQFYSLHKELVGAGKMSNKAFHDSILKENRIPVEMVRAILTRNKLSRDYRSNWKFYGAGTAGR